MRTIHHHQQGSRDWLQHRASIFNASEAPSVMGASKYTSRAELMRQKSTGLTPEVNAATQALFDRGHAVEGPTVALIEQAIDESLAPVVASLKIDGMVLGASYDGLSLMEDVACEIKLWNEELAAQVRAGELSPHYFWQLEHQLIVTPSLERIAFATSDGTPERFVWMEYRPVPGRREALLAGWAQFKEDLAAYVPAESVAPVAVAAPVESLPAVVVQMSGSLAVHSNLDAFGTALRTFIARIPEAPSSDQEFADTEAACKALKRAEDALEAEDKRALDGMADVATVRRVMADLRELARTTRLQREKMVKARKEQLRLEQVQRGRTALAKYLQGLNQRLGGGYMPDIPADFAGVIAGKKNLTSIADAIDGELARAKIAANEVADRIQINLQALPGLAGERVGLTPDLAALVLKSADDFAAVVGQRVAAQRQAEEKRAAELVEKERARIVAEERALAEVKVRQEQEAAAREQRAREEAEALERRQREAAAAPTPAPSAAPVAAPVAANVVPMPTKAPADDGARINLSDIKDRLAPIQITAEGLASLGFPHVAQEKASKLYRASDLGAICTALIRHLEMVRAQRMVA